MKGVVSRAGVRLGLLLATLAAGCAGLGEFGGWPSSGAGVRSSVSEERTDPVRETLARAAALSAEEAEDLLPEAVEAFRKDRSPESRLWVLLLLLRAPSREFGDAWALEVLEAARAGREGAGSQGDVESLLESVFEGRLQLGAALRRSEAGLAAEREAARALRSSLEAERARVHALQVERDESAGRLRRLQVSLEEERRRVADLEGQLEQLKAIEKILERREGPAAGEGAQ